MTQCFLLFLFTMVMRVVVKSSTVGVIPGVFRGRPLWLVRDDLLRLGEEVTGNKGRKFEGILEDGKFVASRTIASYGGAQSNSMVALSHIARASGKRFVYFTRPLPEFLETTLTTGPNSNYRTARKNGMEVVQVKESAVFQRLVDAEKLSTGFPPSFPIDAGIQSEGTYWVPQGGALPEAETGCARLAKLVADHVQEQTAKASAASLPKKKNWLLVMAAGTGTTALYTARSLRSAEGSIEVAAVPCAGSGADLMEQMRALDRVSGDRQVFPTLLEGPTPRVFAQPYAEHLALWRELGQELKVTFDLIYAPRTLEALLASEAWQDAANTEIMLYCCGGSEGNVSQLLRYRREGLLL